MKKIAITVKLSRTSQVTRSDMEKERDEKPIYIFL